MARLDSVDLVAFDFFGTLVRNDVNEWRRTVALIAEQQRLPVSGNDLYAEFSVNEVEFRKTRTNMADPAASPPFRSYREAWGEAFAAAFDSLGLRGDADAAAAFSVERLADQPAFPDAHAMLDAVGALRAVAVLSNADDRFLHGSLAHNGWPLDRFACVESSESLRAYKPDPRIFARFVERAGVPPERILYVGDSPYDDAHGAGLAGMTTALVQRDQNTPGRTPPPDAASTALLEPDYAVESLAELAALFTQQERGR